MEDIGGGGKEETTRTCSVSLENTDGSQTAAPAMSYSGGKLEEGALASGKRGRETRSNSYSFDQLQTGGGAGGHKQPTGTCYR